MKASIEFQEKITNARFYGDFFLHPEEALEQIEHELVGITIPFSVSELEQKIGFILKKNNAELIGATPTDFVAVLQEAINHAQHGETHG